MKNSQEKKPVKRILGIEKSDRMKNLKRIGLGLLIVLGIAGVYYYPKYQMLQEMMHLFDEDRIVENFRSFNTKWPVSDLTKSAKAYKYAQGEQTDLPLSFEFEGGQYSSEEFIMDSRTTGLIVIQNDSIIFENYYLGNTAETRNISWSMAKSYISALMGIAVEEGHITSVMQTVDEYAPVLKGSGYEGVTIKDVLQMSTGVGFNEDYGDMTSDINRWGMGFATGASQDKFATTLEREVEPGTVNHYVSINTHVLGMVITAATGRTITDYMQEKLWTPMGMEHDAYWLIDGSGMEMVLGGLNATLRDFAKIGSLFLHKGNWNGSQIVPTDWVRVSTTPDAPHLMPGGDGYFGYGYQWWIPPGDEGEFMAMGVYNQNIYINPTTKTVIAKLSANHNYNDNSFLPSRTDMAVEMYREILKKYRVTDNVETELMAAE